MEHVSALASIWHTLNFRVILAAIFYRFDLNMADDVIVENMDLRRVQVGESQFKRDFKRFLSVYLIFPLEHKPKQFER